MFYFLKLFLELSLYEFYRIFQEVIIDGIEILILFRSFYSELMCFICLDMFKNIMMIKEVG